MIVLLAVGIAVIAGVAVVGMARRRLVDERQSVLHYQQTLDTLRQLGDRNGERRAPAHSQGQPAPVVAHVASPKAEPRRRITKQAPSLPAEGQPASDERSPVTDDAGGVAPVTPAVRELATGRLAPDRPRRAGGGGSRRRRRARHARGRPESRTGARRTRRTGLLALVLAAALVAGVVAAASPSQPRRSSAMHRVSTSSVAVPRHSAPSSRATRPAASKAAPSTPGPLEPVAESAASATYQVAGSSYTVQLAATGPCWILATDAGGGQVLWTGTLAAGQARTVPAQGGLVLRLGAAWNVQLSADGRAVQLPPGDVSPFEVSFTSA